MPRGHCQDFHAAALTKCWLAAQQVDIPRDASKATLCQLAWDTLVATGLVTGDGFQPRQQLKNPEVSQHRLGSHMRGYIYTYNREAQKELLRNGAKSVDMDSHLFGRVLAHTIRKFGNLLNHWTGD